MPVLLRWNGVNTDNTSHLYVYLVLSSLTISDYDVDVMLIEKLQGEDILNAF